MKRKIIASIAALAAAFGLAASAGASTATNGELFFTTFAGGNNVNKVSYNFNGISTFSLGSVVNIAATPGADGVVFDTAGFLLVGGQGNIVHRVNPTSGAFTSVNAGGTSAFHIMLDPSGTKAWTSGIPGTPASIPLTPFANGTAHPLSANPLSGGDLLIDTIAWSNPTTPFYTSSGPSGFGNFGQIDLNTFVTTRKITGLPAAHGMTFDPFSGDLILFGDSHISQIDPANPTVVLSDAVFNGVTFDQGTVDGKGHIFGATNNGFLFFLDYSTTKLVASADFVASPFLAPFLDDVAPLVGPGAPPRSAVPEPGTIALLASGFVGLMGFRRYVVKGKNS